MDKILLAHCCSAKLSFNLILNCKTNVPSLKLLSFAFEKSFIAEIDYQFGISHLTKVNKPIDSSDFQKRTDLLKENQHFHSIVGRISTKLMPFLYCPPPGEQTKIDSFFTKRQKYKQTLPKENPPKRKRDKPV